jgi:hypothetical protein
VAHSASGNTEWGVGEGGEVVDVCTVPRRLLSVFAQFACETSRVR